MKLRLIEAIKKNWKAPLAVLRLVQVLVWVHTSNKQKIKEVAKQMETPG